MTYFGVFLFGYVMFPISAFVLLWLIDGPRRSKRDEINQWHPWRNGILARRTATGFEYRDQG